MANTATTGPRRVGPCFSASKCPPSKDSTCELPFGFVWTPLQPQPTSSSVVNAHGDICISCLAYVNMYANVVRWKENRDYWVCPFCETRNAVRSTTSDHHQVISPVVEYRQILETTDDILPKQQVSIMLVIDSNLPKEEVQAIGKMIEDLVRSSTSKTWKIGLMVFDSQVAVYQLGTSSGLASCQVFLDNKDLIDDPSFYLLTKSSVDPLWTALGARFGFSPSSTDTTPAPAKSRLQVLKERKEARLREQQNEGGGVELDDPVGVATASPWIVPPSATTSTYPRATGLAIQCALDMSISGTRIWLFTNGCPNLGDGSVIDAESHDIADYKLAQSISFFRILGQSVDSVAVDVFCSGALELALPAYQALVEASGGYAISHDTFTTTHLLHNASHVLNHTSMSLGLFREEETDECTMPSELESWLEGCTVDIRISSFLTATHLIGPGELMESAEEPLLTEQATFQETLQKTVGDEPRKRGKARYPDVDFLQSCLMRIHMGRIDELATFSVMLRTNEFFQNEEHAFFQFVVRYVQNDILITRVSTHRLAVASNAVEFLDSIDEEVIPVMLAKEAVYRSMFGRNMKDGLEEQPASAPAQVDDFAFDTQNDLDFTVFKISASFRLLSLEKGTRSIDLTKEKGVKPAGTSMDFAFPPELSDALRRLYHLRRGPYLSPGPLQSLDDRSEIRSIFVRFPLEDCLTMMAPALWGCGDLASAVSNRSPSFEDIPPETLSLWDNRILAADHWHSLFVWSGAATSDRQYDIVRRQMQKFLDDRSSGRFPMPNFHSLREGDSMSRRFVALLAPSHGDPVEHQVAHYQSLAQLSEEERRQLNKKFHFYDPEVDPSFRKWFWEVASASNGGSGKGVSLCD